MAAALPPQKAPGERTLLEGVIHLITILFTYKWLIAATTVIAAGTAVFFSMISLLLPPAKSPLPNTYRAYAVLLLQQEEAASLESTLASLGLRSTEAARVPGFDYSSLAMRVMHSREFLDGLVDRLNIHQRFGIDKGDRTSARNVVLSHSSFEYDKTTRTLTVSSTYIDPVFAHDLVANMVDQLNEWFLTRGGTNKLKRKEALEAKLAEVSQYISQLEDQVKSFQEIYGVLRVEDLTASRSQILDILHSQLQLKENEIQGSRNSPRLANLRSERDSLLEQIRLVQSGPANPIPELAQRFEHLTSALTIQKNIFDTLSQQYELIKLSLESEPVFTVLDAAEVPDHKTGPSRATICMMTTLLAFIGSMVLALLLHSLKTLLRDSGRARRMIGRIDES
jgi:uncharacterized protein involved in exopolysaccharide biosynthesis